MKKFWLSICAVMIMSSCSDNNSSENNNGSTDEPTINWQAAADSSTTALIHSFWNSSEHYFNNSSNGDLAFNYWPQAHALDVLVDAFIRTKDSSYATYISQWYDGVPVKNGNTLYNVFFDDMEWNALALLRAYEVTNDDRYKEGALELWDYIKKGWNDNAGGGVSWKADQPYSKNACSNGPAAILAARLYQAFGDEADKEWAHKIYNWEKSTLFNASTGAVADNINSNTGEINDGWIFTYNEGTFIGAAIELHKIEGEKSYLNDAVKAADYTISTLVSNSILKDEGTGDGGLFKGVFVRYFTQLIQQSRLDASDKRRYVQFLSSNATTLWNEGTTKPAVLFGTDWRKAPGASTGLTEQLSGCMLIEAMALLEQSKAL